MGGGVHSSAALAATVSLPGTIVGGIPADSLFLPFANDHAVSTLLDTVWRRRQRRLLILALQVSEQFPALAERTGFDAAIAFYRCSPQLRRRALLDHPPFRGWLNLFGRMPLAGDAAATCDVDILSRRLSEFVRLEKEARSAPENPRAGLPFELQRYDVDPLIAEVAPPSFVFDGVHEKKARDARNPYTLSFFGQVLEAALAQIRLTWPQMAAMIPHFVKVIIHLPYVEFRSCSAQRFAGAIMLTVNDETLLEVEESLIHECGHQVLYAVMEIEPLIQPRSGSNFVLPWSGAERDGYGYFHAAYIYLLLALYYERVLRHRPTEDGFASERLEAILAGLKKALPQLHDTDIFTPAGQAFLDRMVDISAAVIARTRPLGVKLREE